MIKVAAVQSPPVFLNLEESINKAAGLMYAAQQSGAELILFPETWLPGYPIWFDYAPKAAMWGEKSAKNIFKALHENSIVVGSPQFNILKSLIDELKLIVLIGANELDGGTIYNSIFYFNGETGEFAKHRKLVPTYTERLVWGMGDGSTLEAIKTTHGVIGGLICWEHWMPAARIYMHRQNEAIHAALWPTVHELHLLSSQHYAFEGRCFVIASGGLLSKSDTIDGINSHGRKYPAATDLLDSMEVDGGMLQKGGSCVIAPDTSIIAEQNFDGEIIYSEFDPDSRLEEILTLDTTGHYSRPDIFTLNVNTKNQSNIEKGASV